jgi:hypothetical protein
MKKQPSLVPGPAFHLEGDGQWDVQELPEFVLNDASYVGEIKIDGYPAVVFETSAGDQWSQKAPGTPAPKGDEASASLSQTAFERMACRLVSRM